MFRENTLMRPVPCHIPIVMTSGVTNAGIKQPSKISDHRAILKAPPPPISVATAVNHSLSQVFIRCYPFLALLDFVRAYCHGAGVRHPSIRKLKFLRYCCMHPGQILWEATSPPYLQTIFFKIFNFQIFMIFFSFSLTWDPMGAKNSKRYTSNFHPI